MTNRDKKFHREVIGLLPAGGEAKRIAPLPCSKELYPVGFRPVDEGRSVRPKVACHYLLEKMQLAGVTKVYIVLRNGKWDIPAYLTDGTIFNMHLAYLIMRLPFGTPYTLDQAYPFVQDAVVAFGFPDIIFEPHDAFVQLLDRQATEGPDIVLGVFPAERPETMDMVDIDDSGKVRSISLKPSHTNLRYAWICAVWTPVFSSFMHEYLRGLGGANDCGAWISTLGQGELSIGHVIQAAIRDGLQVEAVAFPEHTYLDIGTPEDLFRAVCNITFTAEGKTGDSGPSIPL